MNKNDLSVYVKKECEKTGTIFTISNSDVIQTRAIGMDCSGFFEHDSELGSILGIAGKLDDQTFVEVLAHEFSHYRQWKEGSILWDRCKLTKDEVSKYKSLLCHGDTDRVDFEAGDVFNLWQEKKIELPSDVLNDFLQRTTEVEFDCERRVLELSKELNLKINSKDYAQKSNAYLISYYYSRKTRKWPSEPLYLNKEFCSFMPTIIDEAFCKNISIKLISYINNLEKNK